MKTPNRITFRHMPASAALEVKIREKFAKLGRLYPEIIDCDATVDQVDRHQHQGRHFRVAIGVRIRGEELIANTNHEDAYIALRNAIGALRHQLDRAINKRRLAESIAIGGDESRDSAAAEFDKLLADTAPAMEEDEAVALLSGAARRPDPERVIEGVEQY